MDKKFINWFKRSLVHPKLNRKNFYGDLCDVIDEEEGVLDQAEIELNWKDKEGDWTANIVFDLVFYIESGAAGDYYTEAESDEYILESLIINEVIVSDGNDEIEIDLDNTPTIERTLIDFILEDFSFDDRDSEFLEYYNNCK